jgi:hypothetical protein
MLKRAATQNTMKELNDKLLQRLNASVEEVDKLMA